MKYQGRNVILLVDNALSHVFVASKLKNVCVEFLKPNMTSHIQPLDAGIIHTFKAGYRRLYCSMVLDNDESGRADIYRIDQLHGMRLALHAWNGISAFTVTNCWRHSGILNPNSKASTTGITSDDDITRIEKELSDELEKLVVVDMVTAQNCVTMHEFMEVDSEKETEDVWTVEDFIEQQQLDEWEANGEYIEELDGDLALEDEHIMTLGEACLAVASLERFMHSHVGDMLEEAHQFLVRLKRYVRREMSASFQEQSILSFFSA